MIDNQVKIFDGGFNGTLAELGFDATFFYKSHKF